MGKNNNRDDFSKKVKEVLAKRVNYLCSNPECSRGTIGPSSVNEEFINTGVASHICAAAPGGKRYDINMTPEQRSSIENGIWLCQTCSKIIDSDEKKYTVEILKDWKSKAESRAEIGLIKQINETTNVKKEIIVEESKKDIIEVLNINKNSQWNSVQYGKYLKRFEDLNDYIYCNDFSNFFKKDFIFDDTILNFGKELLEWLMGRKKFPLENLEEFYKELKKIYNINNNDILSRRWKALHKYFEGDINEAHKIYLELLNMKSDNIENWLRDDILVDGRNITIQLERMERKYSINNVFQMEIEKNSRKIVYPNIDRVRSNLYENVLKNIFNYQNKSKYTQIYGVGLEYILNSIQELAYISILFGSITHFKLVRNLLAEVLSIYANCYEDTIFYRNSLKQMILSGKFKDFKKMYNRIKLKEKFVNSNEFINIILSLEESILPTDINDYYIFVFDVYGRYLDDKTYLKFEKYILKIINIGKTCDFDEVHRAWESISNNTERFIKKENLFNIILKYLNKNYSGFFRNFSSILNKIKILELNDNEKQLFINIVNKTKDINDIENFQAMIEVKKYTKTTNFNNILLKESSFGNFCYNIEKKNNIKTLKYIVDQIKSEAEQREKNPGIHFLNVRNYKIGWDNFTKRRYNKDMRAIVLNDILPLARMILMSQNQYVGEKINMIKCLSYIVLVEEDNNILEKIKDIIKNIEIKSAKKDFYESKSKEDLNINIEMVRYTLKEKSLNNILNYFMIQGICNKNTLYEIINCISLIFRNKKNIGNNNLNIIYSIYCLAIQSEDAELVDEAIKLSHLFIDTEYFEDVNQILNKFLDDNNFEKEYAIVNLIYCLNKLSRKKFKNIIEKLRKSNNYNIRYVVNKYLK